MSYIRRFDLYMFRGQIEGLEPERTAYVQIKWYWEFNKFDCV